MIQGKFGLAVGGSLITVQARILAPPAIQYKDERNKPKTINPMGGSWNLMKTRFHVCGNLGPWTYLLIRSDRRAPGTGYSVGEVQETVKDFSGYLQNAAGINSGGLIQNKAGLEIHMEDGQDQSNDNKIQQAFRMYHSSPNRPKFVLVVLPYNDKAIYDSVKTTADTKAGIQTVCVLGPKFLKRNPQYYGKSSHAVSALDLADNIYKVTSQ